MTRKTGHPKLHTYVANSKIKEALDMLAANPCLAEELSAGHREIGMFLPRGPVGNETVLAIACAKGYYHHETLLDEVLTEVKRNIERLVNGPAPGKEAEFREQFGDALASKLPEERKLLLRDELLEPEPNTHLRLLDIAAINKDQVLYDCLVKEYGADEEACSYLGVSAKALMADPESRFPRVGDVIDLLFALHDKDPDLEIGLNTQDTLGNTPLHIACIRRDVAMIERLLAKGVDASIVNNKGCTPLDILRNVDGLYDYREALYTVAQYTGCCDHHVKAGDHHTFTLQTEAGWTASLESCMKALSACAAKPSEVGLFASQASGASLVSATTRVDVSVGRDSSARATPA